MACLVCRNWKMICCGGVRSRLINHLWTLRLWYNMFTLKELGHNSCTSKELIEKYNLYEYSNVYANPNISWENIKQRKGNCSKNTLHYMIVNPSITWEQLTSYGIYSAMRIPIDEINFSTFRDYNDLSYNPNLTLDIVLKYPNEEWNWEIISNHPNITFEMIKLYPDLPWKWNYISVNPNINLDIVLANPEERWNHGKLLSNPNISWEQIQFIIKKYDLKVGRCHRAKNPNITCDIVRDSILCEGQDTWCFSCLSNNHFNKKYYWIYVMYSAI